MDDTRNKTLRSLQLAPPPPSNLPLRRIFFQTSTYGVHAITFVRKCLLISLRVTALRKRRAGGTISGGGGRRLAFIKRRQYSPECIMDGKGDKWVPLGSD